jgi:8-oxo-dGTP diphosphatase
VVVRIIAKALLFDSSRNVLILRRSKTHPQYALHPDFPGGVVEDGESAASTVSREIDEEAGIKLDISRFKLVHEKKVTPTRTYLIFEANLSSENPEVKLSWEHDKYEWLLAEQLLNRPLPEDPDDFYTTALDYLKSLRVS